MSADPSPAPAPTRILLLGANGFIGALIAARLRRRGHCVIEGVRELRDPALQRQVDLLQRQTASDWLPLLRDVDAVVNAAGILRERGRQRFAAIHEGAVRALGEACVEAGIRRVVQISALGDPADSEFIASKHRGDAALLALPLSVAVLRPSVVYSTRGSHGGTSLLRALAALPGLLVLPADGSQRLQPMAAEDLAELVGEALHGTQRGVFDCGGPEAISLRDYLAAWRGWLGLPPGRLLATPRFAVELSVQAGERLGRGPLNATIWRMLERGNVLSAESAARTLAAFEHRPQSLAARLAADPAQTQDRWHAGLLLWAPVLRGALVLLWLVSGIAGLVTPAGQIEALAAGSPLDALQPVALARATGILDLLLAGWLASGWRPRLALALMFASVLAYTGTFGILLPALWLDPLGGLVKNLVVLPALAILWVQSGAR